MPRSERWFTLVAQFLSNWTTRATERPCLTLSAQGPLPKTLAEPPDGLVRGGAG